MKDRSEHGWYITRSLKLEDWTDLKSQSGDGNVVAWGPTTDPAEPTTFPAMLHVPFWSKKATMKVTSYVAWFDAFHTTTIEEMRNAHPSYTMTK